MQLSTSDALALMLGRGARNVPRHAPNALGFHDPVYDESGGQGDAIGTVIRGDVQTMQPEQSNPGVLMLVVIVLGIILMMGED